LRTEGRTNGHYQPYSQYSEDGTLNKLMLVQLISLIYYKTELSRSFPVYDKKVAYICIILGSAYIYLPIKIYVCTNQEVMTN
jgi:hypothetical protein